MVKTIKWVVLSYLVALLVYAVYSLAVLLSPAAASAHYRIFKPLVGFNVSDQDVFYADLFIGGAKLPRDPRVSSTQANAFSDYNAVVILLAGREAALRNEPMKVLGLDAAKFADAEPGASTRVSSVSLKARVHPLPFYVHRRTIAVVDRLHLLDTYEPECFLPLIIDVALSLPSQARREACKLASSASN